MTCMIGLHGDSLKHFYSAEIEWSERRTNDEKKKKNITGKKQKNKGVQKKSPGIMNHYDGM